MSTREALEWFNKAKFGLFLHWGPYSVAPVEASWPIMAPELSAAAFGPHPPISEAEYVALARRFNPVDFCPEDWVQAAQAAGMRYVILTAKHHDGFCMFDAAGTSYKVTNTPFGRDVCADLAAACARHGMPLGFYYSPPDMHHPGYRDTRRPAAQNWLGEPQRPEWATYLDYMEAHLRQLLTAYGPVSILWFDGLAGHEKYDPARFRRLLAELSPGTLVNDRFGEPFDYVTPEQFIPRGGVPVRRSRPHRTRDADFRFLLRLLKVPGLRGQLLKAARRYAEGSLALAPMPTSPAPGPGEFQPWETCMTMNKSWGYHPDPTAYKRAEQLIRSLIEVASRGGNLLLNVGPTPQGTLPPEALERLAHIGQWLAVHGESIHGTTYGPLQDLPFARTTARDGTVYLHVLSWPETGQLTVDHYPGSVSAVLLLTTGELLPFRQSEGRLAIDVPRRAPDPVASTLAIHRGCADGGI